MNITIAVPVLRHSVMNMSQEDNENIGDFGMSLADIVWLADQLALEKTAKKGEDISAPTALSEATGASYTAARMWISGESIPRRKIYIDKIVKLMDARHPLFQLRITKGDATLLKAIASELVLAMGPHGSDLADRIRVELDRCNKLLQK